MGGKCAEALIREKEQEGNSLDKRILSHVRKTSVSSLIPSFHQSMP